MDEEKARKIVSQVQVDYSVIADHFSKTRRGLWPGLLRFKELVKEKDRVLDVGCGNGRLFEMFKGKDVNYVGVDVSKKLVRIASSKYGSAEFKMASGLDLPFKDDSFDAVFSVAVLHHVPSKKLRLKFLKEAKRVLKEKGVLVVLVWNLWRRNFLFYHLKHFFLKIFGSGLDFFDIYYPWKDDKGEVMAERYIHCFFKRELVGLVKEAGFEVKEAGFTKGKRNIFIVGRP